MTEVTPAELRALPAQGLHLIDVREPAEYAALRLADSTLIPLSTLEERAPSLDQARPIVLVCHSGSRAAQAARSLEARGFADVRVLAGGLQAWKRLGLPVEQGASRVWPLERQVRFAAGALVLAGFSLAWLVHPWCLALSAFVGAGLVFSAVTDSCAMAMLLARLPWNQDRPG